MAGQDHTQKADAGFASVSVLTLQQHVGSPVFGAPVIICPLAQVGIDLVLEDFLGRELASEFRLGKLKPGIPHPGARELCLVRRRC